MTRRNRLPRPVVQTVLLFSLVLSTCPCSVAQDPDPEEPAEHGTEPSDRPVNRLADATSPYLFQHRHNPVDWYPWGEEALAKARAENKPIFLSIGYTACHWCHVMERESFEDEATARLMNEWFVNVKVDREERPDLDEIYMTAVVGMTGSGGWPMSVFLTPELQPFYGGTYFPPVDRGGLPAFRRVLERMHELWVEQPDVVRERGGEIADAIRSRLAPATDPADPTRAILDAFTEQSLEHFDAEHGGFGQAPQFAPKFPHASELLVLCRRGAALESAGETERAGRLRAVVTQTLTAMAEGGIYDQLGGGFHRYSTDREWLVPHFEKMLYDNALLLEVYSEAYAWTGESLFRQVIDETVGWMLREMQSEQGGFYASQDADSEGEEGRFFVWDLDEVVAVCGGDAPVVRSHFGVRAGGNWEGRTVLAVQKRLGDVAKDLGVTVEQAEAAVTRGKQALFAARTERVRPMTDDKVLAAWNGMAIRGLASAYRVTRDERVLRSAQRAAEFVLESMVRGGRLLRSYRDGDLRLMGYLEDHAFVADGLVALFECDGNERWAMGARDLCVQTDQRFGDDLTGSFFFTADDHEELISRTRNVQESAQPSGIAMAVLVNLRVGLLFGDEALFGRGLEALRAHHATLSSLPIACPGLVVGVDFALSDPREVVIVGDPSDRRTRELADVAYRAVPWHRITAVVSEERAMKFAEWSPIFAGKTSPGGVPTAWVCRRGVCEAPVSDPTRLLR